LVHHLEDEKGKLKVYHLVKNLADPMVVY
jgi:hypothetical protein